MPEPEPAQPWLPRARRCPHSHGEESALLLLQLLGRTPSTGMREAGDGTDSISRVTGESRFSSSSKRYIEMNTMQMGSR